MMDGPKWRIMVVFDNHDQAEHAAKMLISIQPREYTFSCTEGQHTVWTERGSAYFAREKRV